MQKHVWILSIFFLFPFVSNAQFTVTGVVLDSATREPLSPASVFCQNTTLGTITNKEGSFSISLKAGAYDLIFSFTGYQTQTIRVSENKKLELLLSKEDKSMSEVVIKSSNEVADGWQKYGDFFVQNFIGATPNASKNVLLNPEVLKFFYYKRSNKLKVLATDLIRISNNALGYNIRYQLDSFIYYYGTNVNSYRGYCFFSEMEGNDSTRAVWLTARKRAYQGSLLHFMRSYYDSTIHEEGWIIDLLDEKNDKKFVKVGNVYDSSYFNLVMNSKDSLGADSIMHTVITSSGDVEIFYPRKISVTYTKKFPEPEYLKKMSLPKSVPYQISYIDVKDWIIISENGYYYDPKNWVNQGYWSWKNLGDLLPFDYLPPD